ncbi:MAG: ROK family protein [Erysipelotrichaceae bacterium]|nr:ROK family protein [Erysipelotrichaceae bacterium]
MAKRYKVCLDIGGTKILGVIFNENNEIVYRLKKRTKGSGEATENVEQVIIDVVAEMLKKSGISRKELIAIAAGAPGVIDQANGIVLFSPNLPWRDYDIRTPLEKKFGVPFYIGNDVNVGVLGEYKYGAGKGYQNVVAFFVGTGMGGGLILDGKLYTGSHFKGAEFGHLILDPDGPLCNCGQRGCLEAFSSKQGITKYIRQQIGRGRPTMMEDHLEGATFRSKYLKKALKEKDPVAVEAVNRACHWLAVATGNMINTFSPDIVIYGGGVIEATGDLFVKKILKDVDRYCMPSIRNTVELKSAALGDDSIIYGALSLIEETKQEQ